MMYLMSDYKSHMTDKDFLQTLLEENRLDGVFREKAQEMYDRMLRNEQKQKENRARRSAARHEAAMEEIRAAVDDGAFTPTDIQLSIVAKGKMPHTRQYYSSHLMREMKKHDESRVERVCKDGTRISVIFANNRGTGTQGIGPRFQWGYQFK